MNVLFTLYLRGYSHSITSIVPPIRSIPCSLERNLKIAMPILHYWFEPVRVRGASTEPGGGGGGEPQLTVYENLRVVSGMVNRGDFIKYRGRVNI